ncbi:hypothetical protein AB0M38_31430 [Streptomyces sp. NPDC051742]|uniref:hypothetical protein n=1 Tax=unclassified Streptomyces TaxID=2593676 RepID=UPI003427A97C
MDPVAAAQALGEDRQAKFLRAGLSQCEIARGVNVNEAMVFSTLRKGVLPSANLLESMLALLPIPPDEARNMYASRAAIEAVMHWQTRHGKEAIATLQQQGVLDLDVGMILPEPPASRHRAEQSASRRRRGTGPRPSRYVPKSGQPDPTGVSSPAELQQVFQAVHVWGGSPSLRELEKHSDGVLRRSTMSDMLRGAEPSVPDYDRYIAFLRACGIDDASPDTWVFTWRRLVALQQSPEVAGWMSGMATRA